MARARAKGLRRRLVRGALFFLLLALGSSVGSVLLMRWVAPWTSAFMVATRKDALLEGDFAYANDYRWVSLEQISPHAAIAVIASEDQQFPFHAGFDFKSIREAVRHNAHSKKVRGASTISQQVAKNLFLWPQRSWLRKTIEAPLALWIDLVLPKRRILEIYLNVAEWGPGTWGIEAGSRRAFGKAAADLGPREAALMAVALPNPILRDPKRADARLARLAAVVERRARAGDGATACLR